MTELLSHVGVRHAARSQQTSTSSSEVWAVDLRPLVDVAPWWLDHALDRADELYKDGLVRREALVALRNTLDDSLWADAPAPFISSTDDCGISAEFEAGSLHLDIEAGPVGSLLVYLADRGFHDWQGPMDEMPEGIQKWGWRLGLVNRDKS